MNKKQLVTEVSELTGYPKTTVNEIINATLATIAVQLKNGLKVELRGFGVFYSLARKKRIGNNLAEKIKMVIPACNYPSFKPHKSLKKIVNNEK